MIFDSHRAPTWLSSTGTSSWEIGQCRSSSSQSPDLRYGKYDSSPSGKLLEPVELASVAAAEWLDTQHTLLNQQKDKRFISTETARLQEIDESNLREDFPEQFEQHSTFGGHDFGQLAECSQDASSAIEAVTAN